MQLNRQRNKYEAQLQLLRDRSNQTATATRSSDPLTALVSVPDSGKEVPGLVFKTEEVASQTVPKGDPRSAMIMTQKIIQSLKTERHRLEQHCEAQTARLR